MGIVKEDVLAVSGMLVDPLSGDHPSRSGLRLQQRQSVVWQLRSLSLRIEGKGPRRCEVLGLCS